jgi:hypothetical protein
MVGYEISVEMEILGVNNFVRVSVVALDQGGPSAGHLARSTKVEDKDSPLGGRTEGTTGRSATASQRRRAIRKPTCGKKTKAAAVHAKYSLRRGAHLP